MQLSQRSNPVVMDESRSDNAQSEEWPRMPFDYGKSAINRTLRISLHRSGFGETGYYINAHFSPYIHPTTATPLLAAVPLATLLPTQQYGEQTPDGTEHFKRNDKRQLNTPGRESRTPLRTRRCES